MVGNPEEIALLMNSVSVERSHVSVPVIFA